MSSLYLNPALEPAGAPIASVVRLTGDEAHHAVSVSRSRIGERISIGNGRGFVATGQILAIGQRELEMRVDQAEEYAEHRPTLVLVQALAKGDRDERAVQAATELGADEIVPWAASRSIVRWEGAKRARAQQRWETIAREASKQSLRAWLPRMRPLASTSDLCHRAETERMLVLDPTATEPFSAIDLDAAERISVVVGPEGGITPDELTQLESAGATRVRLGAGILRTSTAGPAALAVLNVRLGRW